MDFSERLERADRLHFISQRMGYALLRLQQLEDVCATYFVLAAQATRGLGLDAGNALLDAARKKTFGATINAMAKAGLLSSSLESRLRDLLAERNWLVHGSLEDAAAAEAKNDAMQRLAARIDAMPEAATPIMNELGRLTNQHVRAHGITEAQVAAAARRMRKDWETSADE